MEDISVISHRAFADYEHLMEPEKRGWLNELLKVKLRGQRSALCGGHLSLVENETFRLDYPDYLHYAGFNKRLYVSDGVYGGISTFEVLEKKYPDCEKFLIRCTKTVFGSGGSPFNYDPRRKRRRYPGKETKGFAWDIDQNLYICSKTCIFMVHSVTGSLNLLSGSTHTSGFKDGSGEDALFNGLSGLIHDQRSFIHPPVLYACDSHNHVIRVVNIKDGSVRSLSTSKRIPKTSSSCSNNNNNNNERDAEFYHPIDIVKDINHTFYVLEGPDHIRSFSIENDRMGKLSQYNRIKQKNILKNAKQMVIVEPYLYVACEEYDNCIVRVEKKTMEMVRIPFYNTGKVVSKISGITYDQNSFCFYICDRHNIYRFE